MKKLFAIALLGLLLPALLACSSVSRPPEAAQVELVTRLTMGTDGQAQFRAGARNSSAFKTDRIEAFNGLLEVAGPEGKLRSKSTLSTLPALEPGQMELLTGVKMTLPPGDYTLSFTASGQDSLSVPFTVLERDGRLFLRASALFIDPYTDFTVTSESG